MMLQGVSIVFKQIAILRGEPLDGGPPDHPLPDAAPPGTPPDDPLARQGALR